MTAPWMDVFFWALVAATGLYTGMAVFTARRRFSRRTYMAAGIAASLGYLGPRALIPFLPQPALGLPPALALPLGGALLLLGVGILARVVVRLRSGARQPDGQGRPPIYDDGLYGVVRHPMYLGDILWGLGLAVALDAAYAAALTPLWWLLRAGLSVHEEERLVDKYGEAYRAYCERVPARILPPLGGLLRR